MLAYLIARVAARLQHFRVVPLAVDLVVVHTVGQIDQQLVARRALEAARMPDHLVAELRCDHRQLALVNALRTADAVGRVRRVLHVA